jgi:hypothetical protein
MSFFLISHRLDRQNQLHPPTFGWDVLFAGILTAEKSKGSAYDVCGGSLSDVGQSARHVRFTLDGGLRSTPSSRQLCAKGGSRVQ